MKEAYLAGGCFWCIGGLIEQLPGVSQVVSGYAGGSEEDPSYEDVKAQKTGHRETIKVVYDDAVICFPDLLKAFLENVDPFDGGGQFIDRGRSYTLAVYCTDEEEKRVASELLEELSEKAGREVFVAVEPLGVFYEAEEYHQNFREKHPAEYEKEMIESGRKKE